MRDYLTTDKQLLGAAGTYYVMSELSSRGFHASCTFGNAPHVDILVSSPDGSKSVAVQVKTTEHAKRHTGRKGQPKTFSQLQWYLGRKAAKANLTGLFIVFVDYDKWGSDSKTDCYVVPSKFVFEFCRPWIDSAGGMVRLHISPEQMSGFLNAWHLLATALASPITPSGGS